MICGRRMNAFLREQLTEVIPCVEVDHRKIGSGLPGETTKSFISEFREQVESDGVKL